MLTMIDICRLIAPVSLKIEKARRMGLTHKQMAQQTGLTAGLFTRAKRHSYPTKRERLECILAWEPVLPKPESEEDLE